MIMTNKTYYNMKDDKPKSNNNVLKCSLCSWEFKKDDPNLKRMLLNHYIWHVKAQLHKRNTTQGKPKYN